MDCKTEFLWPDSYLPARVRIVDTKTGQETVHVLRMKDGRLLAQGDAEEEEAVLPSSPAGADKEEGSE